jgi:acyl-coenzyme A synthetase/AMP-(fatty) acid ligase
MAVATDADTTGADPQRIVDLLHRAADAFGEREFLVTPSVRLTFADAEQESKALAKQLLAAGIGKGTRVAVHLPAGPEWMVAFLATARIGALFMPFSAAYKPAELRRALRLGDVHLLIAGSESWHGGSYAAFLEEAVPEIGQGATVPLRVAALPYLRSVWCFGNREGLEWTRPLRRGATGGDTELDEVSDDLLAAVEEEVKAADDAIVIWTSGTTADPKGAIHTQGTVARRGPAMAYAFAFEPGDRVFLEFAFWWVGGFGYGFLPALWSGATLLAVPRHSRETTEAFLARERPTRVSGRLARDIMSRVMATGEGSSSMMAPPAIGMTETFGAHSMYGPTALADYQAAPMPGLGPPILGFERKIVDPDTGVEVADGEDGELLVRGPSLMRGLYKREREDVFDADGWFHTGDRCIIHDGTITFVSRSTDMIKTSGSNVAPLEVEMTLMALPEVQEAVVLGCPDRKRGQVVVAVVVAQEGATVEEEALREWVRSQLSNYKVPRHVLVMHEDEMPRLHSGKPDKRALETIAGDHIAALETARATN